MNKWHGRDDIPEVGRMVVYRMIGDVNYRIDEVKKYKFHNRYLDGEPIFEITVGQNFLTNNSGTLRSPTLEKWCYVDLPIN